MKKLVVLTLDTMSETESTTHSNAKTRDLIVEALSWLLWDTFGYRLENVQVVGLTYEPLADYTRPSWRR